LQLTFLQTSYSTQTKDTAFISKEVLHEYDTKYVRPRTQPVYRDVGTQFSEQASYTSARDEQYNKVEVYTPMVVINRGFHTNSNPNYTKYTDPEGATSTSGQLRHRLTTPDTRTPMHNAQAAPATKPLTAMRQPNFRPPSSGGDGGSLGVYSHAASPLRKSASTNFARDRVTHSPEKRPASPEKRMSVPAGGINTLAAAQRWGHLKPDSHRRETGRF